MWAYFLVVFPVSLPGFLQILQNNLVRDVVQKEWVHLWRTARDLVDETVHLLTKMTQVRLEDVILIEEVRRIPRMEVTSSNRWEGRQSSLLTMSWNSPKYAEVSVTWHGITFLTMSTYYTFALSLIGRLSVQCRCKYLRDWLHSVQNQRYLFISCFVWSD